MPKCYNSLDVCDYDDEKKKDGQSLNLKSLQLFASTPQKRNGLMYWKKDWSKSKLKIMLIFLSLYCYLHSHSFRSKYTNLTQKLLLGKFVKNTWLKFVQNHNNQYQSQSNSLTIYLNCPSKATKECFLSHM